MTEERGVWLTLGCHPQFASIYGDEADNNLLKALQHPRVVALGEIGLDDRWARGNVDVFETQVRVFERQLKIAISAEKPICIHIRGEKSARVANAVMRQV